MVSMQGIPSTAADGDTGRVASEQRGSILVTGMPRSGTTWLARLLALAPGASLAGREPMNPRGRQYALGGTLDGWTRLTEPTARQRLEFKLAFRGLNPLVYSRYGVRQWAAPLPRTRLVVKDPFAMLSIPAAVEATGSRAVLVYRHPGAMLASYRRMGWLPDLAELAPVVNEYHRDRLDEDLLVPDLDPAVDPASPEAMGWFWNALYAMAVADLRHAPDTVVVSHEDVASGGPDRARDIYSTLGLSWGEAAEAEVTRKPTGHVQSSELHNFDRASVDVANEWRSRLTASDVRAVEKATESMRDRLEAVRTVLG